MKSNRELDHEKLLSEYIITKDTLSHLIEENEDTKNRVVSLLSEINSLDGQMLGIKLQMSELNMNLQEIEEEIINMNKIANIPVIGKALSLFLPKDRYDKSLESTLEEHRNNDYYLLECITNKRQSEDDILLLNEKIERNNETIINLKNVEKEYEYYFNNQDEIQL